MKDLYISVAGKTATYLKRCGSIVCDNDDYRVAFIFDEEWEQVLAAGSADLIVRFIWRGKYHDVPLEKAGDIFVAAVPAVDNTSELYAGLYVDGQLRTTTVASIPCQPSLHSVGAKPGPYTGKGYSEEAKVSAQVAQNAAERAEAAQISVTGSEQAAREAASRAESAKAAAERAADTAVALDQSEEMSALLKRLTLLERGLTPNPYHVDDTAAYRKTVPAGAAPYAMLTEVGGMTYKAANLFNAAFAVEADLDRGYQFSVDGTGFTLINTGHETTYTTFRQFCPRAVVGRTYTITYDASMGDYGSGADLSCGDVYLPSGTTFVLTEAMVSSGFDVSAPMMEHGGHEGQVWNIMINEGGTALPWEKYSEASIRDTKVTSILSTKAGGATTIARFAVPTEVQALDGYGWGISAAVYNSIEWDDTGKATFVKRVGRKVYSSADFPNAGGSDGLGYYQSAVVSPSGQNDKAGTTVLCNKLPSGTPKQSGGGGCYISGGVAVFFPSSYAATAAEWRAKLDEWEAAGDPLILYYQLTTPVVTDISHLVSADNLIPVEPGGTLFFYNERSEAAPSTVVYQVKPTE